MDEQTSTRQAAGGDNPRHAAGGSHTRELVCRTVDSIEVYLQEETSRELGPIVSEPDGWALRTARMFNTALHHANVHIGHASEHERAARREYIATAKAVAVGTMRAIGAAPERFDAVYEVLPDDASRRVFDWFVSYRAALAFLGKDADAVTPGFMTEQAWKGVLHQVRRTWHAGAYDVGGVVLRSGLTDVADTFVLEQYRLPGFVEPQEGDIVLDCGAYRGDTALWFARRVGTRGKVIAIEPSSRNAAGLRQNLAANGSAGNAPVVVVEEAVGIQRGTLSFNGSAESTSRADSLSAVSVPVDTIDSLVERLQLPRVDFIKMDIEGGEVDALDGARATLRTFAPRLALSVYHRPGDLPDIVERVRSAVPAYALALSQKSPGFAETILFAKAGKGEAP